jgi:hypothetical protein
MLVWPLENLYCIGRHSGTNLHPNGRGSPGDLIGGVHVL